MKPLGHLVGRHVSLAGRLAYARLCPGEARVGSVFCPDRTHGEAVGARSSWYAGAGRDADLESASAAALGEAFERYCLRDTGHIATYRASVRQLRAQAYEHIPPLSLAPVRASVANEVGVRLHPPPTDDEVILWVRAVDLASHHDVYLPAQYCYFLDHRSRHRPDHTELPWCMAISNGTAAGPTPRSACLSGLLELLERDAFMLMWYHQIQFPRIPVDGHTRLGQRIAAVFGRGRLDVRLFDLSEVHDVPVVIAVARGEVNGQGVYAMGGGAAIHYDSAIWKAAREVAGLYAWARADAATPGPSIKPEQIATYGDHVRYYADPDRHHEFAFLFEDRPGATTGPPREPLQSDADALDRVCHGLSQRGIAAYAVDLTPADACPFGVWTYKVVSPQLIPLDYNHQARHLNRERLLYEPTRRGWRSDQPDLADLNHAPHPFP